MGTLQIVLIFVAGIGAGTINAIVGSGTLITFPTLIAFGIPPVTATMSNAVGQVPGSISGTWGYRRELRGQWKRLRWQMPGSFLGSIAGAFLLLHLPAETFKKVVPVLLVLALILVVTQPWVQRWVRKRNAAAGREHGDMTRSRMALLVLGTFLVGVYGGYFAAAQGVLLVGVMGWLVTDSLQRINAAKNSLSLIVNTVAASAYTIVAFHRIDWTAAALIAAGTLIGGFIGASVGRRLHPVLLRCIIVALGVIAIVRLVG